MSKIYKAKQDVVFKMLFGDKNDTDILSDFLQTVLKYPKDEFEKIEILNPFLYVANIGDKQSIVDVKITTKSGKIIDIEIQVKKMDSMRLRILFYATKLFAGQLKKGEEYEKLKKTINILICTDHILIDENKDYHNRFLMRADDSTVLTDAMEINTLELKKIPKGDNSRLVTWLKFLDTDNKEELDMIATQGAGLKKAVDRLIEISEDEKAKAFIEAREKALHDEATLISESRQQGIIEGMEKGMEKGKHDREIEIAKSLLKAGMNSDFIKQHTGLTEEEIQKLR